MFITFKPCELCRKIIKKDGPDHCLSFGCTHEDFICYRCCEKRIHENEQRYEEKE